MFNARFTQHLVGRRQMMLGAAATTVLALAACNGDSGIAATPSGERAAPASIVPEGVTKTDRGWSFGAEDAPVTVVEYGSFTCGGCGYFHKNVFPKIMDDYVKPGYVRFEFRSFLRNQPDILATSILHCSGPERFEGFSNLYFSSQPQWLTSSNPNDYVAEMVRKAGVNSARFRQCTGDAALRAEILANSQRGIDEDKVSGTPFVMIDGKPLNGDASWQNVSEAVEAALRS